MKRIVLCLLAVFLFSVGTAGAENQVDKVVPMIGATPALVGHPSIRQTGAALVGTVDFVPSAINFWMWNGSQWVFASGNNLSVTYSAQDSQLYGKPVYRYFVSGLAAGSFTIQYIDVDFYNPNTRTWAKMSTTNGFAQIGAKTITKSSF